MTHKTASAFPGLTYPFPMSSMALLDALDSLIRVVNRVCGARLEDCRIITMYCNRRGFGLIPISPGSTRLPFYSSPICLL